MSQNVKVQPNPAANKTLHKKVILNNAKRMVGSPPPQKNGKKERKIFTNINEDLKMLAFFTDETFTSTLTKSNEIEFSSPNSMYPIKIGYVSNGSALQGSMLAVYLKHRPAWRALEQNGLVYIMKRIDNQDEDNPSSSSSIYRTSYERERYSIILIDTDTFLKIYKKVPKHTLI